MKSTPIFPPIKVYYLHGKKWLIIEPITVALSNGEEITVPVGMETDLSSSPKYLWGLFPPYGDFLLAAIIHDYLYIYDYKKIEWGNKKAKAFADYQMLYFSNLINKNYIDNYLRYLAVRLFGKKVWKISRTQ